MRNKYIAMCLTIGAMSIGLTAAQSQKPGESTTDPQHHQMVMGLTDTQFASMMAKHHQQGIDMARQEEERGSSASVKALAAKIRESQEKDLPELKAHSQQQAGAKGTSGHDTASEHSTGDHTMDHGKMDAMMEQQGQAMMSELKSQSGSALDHAFLEHMAKHHEMAISMTQGAKLQDPELKKLAQKMIAGQRQELAELKKELASHK